jgi:hypothetical protein
MAEEAYRILGLSPGAPHAEVKKAYRRLVKAFHPDAQGGRGNAQVFARIVQAYQSLQREHGLDAPGRKPEPRTQPGRPGAREARSREARPREPAGREPLDIFTTGRTLLLDPDPVQRAAAARLLGESGRRSAYAFLRKALWDREERVLVAVVRAIGALEIHQAVGELGSLYSKAGAGVKREILALVGKMPGVPGFESIARMAAADVDPVIRGLASRALARGAVRR